MTAKATIAIIEDDQAIANMYKAKLEAGGYDVQVAVNGQDGLKLVEDSKPKIILLDLMMPVMNGLEVLEHFKKNPESKHGAKVVVLSNMGDTETSAKIAGYKVDDRIIKAELTPAQVEERVAKLVG